MVHVTVKTLWKKRRQSEMADLTPLLPDPLLKLLSHTTKNQYFTWSPRQLCSLLSPLPNRSLTLISCTTKSSLQYFARDPAELHWVLTQRNIILNTHNSHPPTLLFLHFLTKMKQEQREEGINKARVWLEWWLETLVDTWQDASLHYTCKLAKYFWFVPGLDPRKGKRRLHIVLQRVLSDSTYLHMNKYIHTTQQGITQ